MSTPRRCVAVVLIATACSTSALAAGAPPARANPFDTVCSIGGWFSGVVGKACTAVTHVGRIFSAGKKLLTGHLGSAVKTLLGEGGSAAGAATKALGVAAIAASVLGGAHFVLHETADLIGQTTAPRLTSTWFSSTYWRVAGIAALLTLPFLFAAAIQALLASDPSLLARAVLGYLPLAMLAVGIAAPLTMLLLAASDQLSAVVSAAAGNASTHFLASASLYVGLLTLLSHSPFVAFFVGLFTVSGAVVLWIELLMREVAVYVIVLMLPLAFAAFVWPARRIWAVRTVELLVALVLSKFAIVAVLSLGGAALSQGFMHSVASWIAGLVLLVIAAFAPWVLLRLLPMSELAASAASSLRHGPRASGPLELAHAAAVGGEDWVLGAAAGMRRDADAAREPDDFGPAPGQGMSPPGNTTADAGAEAGRAAGSAQGGAAGAAEERAGAEDLPLPDPAGHSAGGSVAGTGASVSAAVRSPGLSGIWQMPDMSWPTLTLGLQNGAAPTLEGLDPDAETVAGDSGEAPGEQHDVTPPPQDPEDGRL